MTVTVPDQRAVSRTREVIEQLVDLRLPSSVVLSDRGHIAFIASDGGPPSPAETRRQLYVGGPGERPLAVALPVDPMPGTLSWSPSGQALAYATGLTGGRSALHLLHDGHVGPPLCEVDATILESRWSRDGQEIALLVLDAGGNSVEPPWGTPRAGKPSKPMVMLPHAGQRRLLRYNVQTRELHEPRFPVTVWEFGWRGGDRVIALISAGTGENDWYYAELAALDLAAGTVSSLHRPPVQMTSVTISPDGERAAFVEGKASDRGLTAGRIRLLDLRDGTVSPGLPPDDVTWAGWSDSNTLYYARWSDCRNAVGRIDLAGGHRELWSGPASLGTNFRPWMAIGGDTCAAVIESFFEPPEIAVLGLDQPSPAWQKISELNSHLSPASYFSVQEVAWPSSDGLEIHGLLLEPTVPNREALVVVGHGGPTIAWTHSFAPSHGSATVLAAAGFPVLLPNPRGSTGRGEDFKRANLGDLGGADYRDITSGVDWCRSTLFEGRPAPAGFVGVSYAGFLASWCAAKGDCFGAVVAISTVTNWTSFLYSSVSGEFARGHLGQPGSSNPPAPPPIFWERSPIANVTASSAPTIILHGDLDNCTPVGQGFELFHALRWAGVDTELVIYPDEGHWPVLRANQVDIHARTVRWLARYLLDPVPEALLRIE